jgi:hypothetical protein
LISFWIHRFDATKLSDSGVAANPEQWDPGAAVRLPVAGLDAILQSKDLIQNNRTNYHENNPQGLSGGWFDGLRCCCYELCCRCNQE